jgi:hypothetical protein
MFEVLEPNPSWTKKIKARVEWVCGHAKDLLRRLGLPIPPKTLEEACMSGCGLTENAWIWEGQDADLEALVAEGPMSWLYDEILKAPSPRGVNTCVVCAAVGKLEAALPSATERWICDKWGWRTEGEETVRAWLLRHLGAANDGGERLAVRLEVYSYARMMLGQGKRIF